MTDQTGFRCSLPDLLLLFATAGATWLLWPVIGAWAALPPLVVGHFFLFCNVFRVGLNRELFWSAIFVLNFLVWVVVEGMSPPWLGVFQAPFTLGVILLAIRDPGYHGLGCSLLGKPVAAKPGVREDRDHHPDPENPGGP